MPERKAGDRPRTPAEVKYDHEMTLWLEAKASEREERSRMFEAVIQFAIGAIKSLFLLNGGAIVALLAFYSDRLAGSGDGQVDVPALAAAIRLFVVGLVVAFGVWASSYLAQVLFVESSGKWGRRAGAAFRILGIIGALGSAALFVIGSLDALDALLAVE